MNINDVIKQGRRGSKQYYHEGYLYRVRVGKIQLPGHCDNLVANDVTYVPWYLTCRKPGCRFVGIVRILNDTGKVGDT